LGTSEPRSGVTGHPSRAALKFILLLGAVSLCADMTYEGARSITGPYLALLGAGGAAVGAVAGLGELIGYGLRLASGYLADCTGRYWPITLGGYALNLVAVPLLALAGRWEVAALLIVAERLGKAIRTPARDAMLSHATAQTGRGWGFGLHEAMDQVGATLGPLVVAAVLFFHEGYRTGFAVLSVPAFTALALLVAARLVYPSPREFEPCTPKLQTGGLSKEFWLYLAAAGLIAAGYVDFPLIAYHFAKAAVIPAGYVPVFYAVAMGVDAAAALFFGRLFDRLGLPTLVGATLISSLFAPSVFLGGAHWALLGMALWGVGMGAQESVMRAALAGMVPPHRRGTAYGIFNTGYGVFWFLGSALAGLLYDYSVPGLIGFSVAAQLASLPLLIHVGKARGTASPGEAR
jgi:MFS family permease